jgi:hypothetical protein
MDVPSWLRNLGFEQYDAIFRRNDIDAPLLRTLTNEDLKEIGVASLGHRRKLLQAIVTLPPEQTKAAIGPALVAGAEAERRHLTVMFCDLVGSTPLSARLDPEELRRIIGAYHRCVTEIVEGLGGFVARYMGDGVLAYFGYPQAHEDDAERATRCGLALVDGAAAESGRRASRPCRDRHRACCRRRRDCRARYCRQYAQSRRALASVSRARHCRDCCEHTPADRQPV